MLSNYYYEVKKKCFESFLKCSKLLTDVISSGNPFQSLGAAVQGALSPHDVYSSYEELLAKS